MALRRPLDVERALYRIEPPFVIERPYLGAIEEGARRLVGNDCAVVPGIPETTHHIDELRRDLVAEIVLRELRLTEIERSLVVRAGDDIPAGAAVAEMIERSESAGDMERFAETRRHRGAESNVGRHHAQRRQQG